VTFATHWRVSRLFSAQYSDLVTTPIACEGCWDPSWSDQGEPIKPCHV